MGVLGTELAQRPGEAQHILCIRAAGASRTSNLGRDLAGGRRPEIVRVVASRHVHHGGDALRTGFPKPHLDSAAFEAPLFAAVEGSEHGFAVLWSDAIGDAPAERIRLRDQRDHPTRRAGKAAVIGGSLPESTRPTFDASGTPLDVGKPRLPHQGSVTEDPTTISRRLRHLARLAERGPALGAEERKRASARSGLSDSVQRAWKSAPGPTSTLLFRRRAKCRSPSGSD